MRALLRPLAAALATLVEAVSKVAARCDELALRLYRALTEGQDEAIERLVAAEPLAPHTLRP